MYESWKFNEVAQNLIRIPIWIPQMVFLLGVVIFLIAVVDGLKGFPEAIGAVYPQTTVQTCIVHLIRNSLAFVSWKDRKRVIQDLRHVYRAATAELALEWLDGFEKRWGGRYPTIAPMWRVP